jgi:hypothetical protein
MKRAGGGKRGSRKPKRAEGGDPKRAEGDDRPRGYEATRMRQLWRDIDHAKHKAGLAPPAEPATPGAWDVGVLCERAAALVGDAAAWLTSAAPAAACSLLASGAELLRAVPVIGWLADLVPGAVSQPARSGRKGPLPAHHGNGFVRPVVVAPHPDNDTDGWIH